MSSRKSSRNTKRQDYSRKDFGCKSCNTYDCKGCDDQVESKDSSSEGSEVEQWIATLPDTGAQVERWIATLSDTEESFQTPSAGSGAETTRVEDRTLIQLDNSASNSDIDSEELPSTGKMEEDPTQRLESEAATAYNDIDDFLDEYDITDVGRIEDLDSAARRIEQLRTVYRGTHNLLRLHLGDEAYNQKHDGQFKDTINNIKGYIKNLKIKRNGIIAKDDQSKEDVLKIKSEKFSHLKKSFVTSAVELEKLFIVSDSEWLEEKDEDVEKRRNDLPQHLKLVQTLESTLLAIMSSSSGKDTYDDVKTRYDKLIEFKTQYVEKLDNEFKSREVVKHKNFNKTKLHIQLPKFKGYAGIDFYSFKSDFEKLYSKDTPTENLADLLKNNFLENPALLLVKHVRDINEIWERLKAAYGDTKVMLSKKIGELSKLDELWKQQDPEKQIEGISKVINLMRDLMHLAKEHSIEDKLYHGDAIDTIHTIMGKSRLRKWLSIVCDKDINDGEDHWKELLVFLEKDVKVCQKEVVLSSKMKPSRRRPNEPSHHTPEDSGNTAQACSICGATDHTKTPGYNGKKLIQYYVCKKFIEMTCKQRFDFLKEKNLCYQCLYPGADHNSGKHKEGKCQRDFTCKHDSHNRFTKKKHVLVCDEHKHTEENKTLLDDYKQRFIMRDDIRLPSHSRSILIHHVSSGDDSSADEGNNRGFTLPSPQVARKCRSRDAGVESDGSIDCECPDVDLSSTDPSPPDISLSSPLNATDVSTKSVTFDLPSPLDIINSSSDNSQPALCFLQPSEIEIQSPVIAEQPSNIIDHSSNISIQQPNADQGSGQPPGSILLTIEEHPGLLQPEPNQQGEVIFPDVEEDAIYILQRVLIDNEEYNFFYDSGCKGFVSNHDAVQRLGPERAFQIQSGPITLEGVAGMTMETPHGFYGVKLPVTGGQALLSGLCLDMITQPFPLYPLKGDVERDIRSAFVRSGGDPATLPSLEPSVGGVTHFMVGKKYNRYFPLEVFRMASGLSIYRSRFQNANGGYGVVGGTHQIFTEIEKYHNFNHSEFVSSQLKIFQNGVQINPDVHMLGFINSYEDQFNHYPKRFVTQSESNGKDSNDNNAANIGSTVHFSFSENDSENNINHVKNSIKRFEESQSVGSEIQYRCPKCRSCRDCKNCEEEISIREEVEQVMLEDSVEVDLEKNIVSVSLPLLADPEIKLAPNRDIAQKVYHQQLKKLKNNSDDKQSILSAEKKLQDLGYVAYVKDLPESTQQFLATHPVQNFFPWRVAWKPNSTTTPCRPVFDASMATQSGYALNHIIPKGVNNLNRLLEVFLRFRTHRVAFHNDVNKMYNGLKLKEAFWAFQRYLFEPNLDSEKPALEKIIITAIYGVKCSGNQATVALRKLAEKFKSQYPEAYDVICKDHYVDDCLSGAASVPEANTLMDELELVLSQGGFSLKAFTTSGEPPDKSLAHTDGSIGISGHLWWPEEDMIGLDVQELNFAKKVRGRKAKFQPNIPTKITRRLCCSKVGEIFDMSGLLAPITATWKLDLHDLVVLKLGWDDAIPENLRSVWENNFSQMTEIKELRYKRAVVPQDAVDLNIETLEFGDASRVLVCIAIYVRFLRKNGSYSCQLLLSKTRLVPDGMSQPRAELYASVVNTHAGEVVRRALQKHLKRSLKFSDSQVALFWFSNDTRVLNLWVRNRAIEIRRLSQVSAWRFVKSHNMAADIGTRRCTSLQAVSMDSDWINGFDWMAKPESDFPCLKVDEIKLSGDEIEMAKKEMLPKMEIHNVCARDALLERYRFSEYVIDPNRHRFQSVIRILAIVFKYIRVLHHRVTTHAKPIDLNVVNLTTHIFIADTEVASAEEYFFRKATKEVKEFLKPLQYERISKESNGILYYVGRVLPQDEVTIVGRATKVMKDLYSTKFCVPITDKHSPIAYSLVNDVHWNDKTVRHCGIETTYRYVLKRMFVIEGRALVRRIKESCNLCRYLEKKALCVPMGPISKFCMMIAPAFYVSQVDIAGPFTAFSYHNKRTTIKIWLLVFCCCTTSATNIKTMEGYSATAFIQSFTRFACDRGYPKRVLIDEGSQLVKGCKTLQLNFKDLQFRLHRGVKVEFETCPVGGHNMHGKVERRIRHIKDSLEKSISNERLGVLQWETLAAVTANCINDLPLATRGAKGDLDHLDLITPNRLLLGRNNDRSPVGDMSATESFDKIIESNARIFNAWFENWLVTHAPQLMDQPKWFKSSRDLKEGDVVLFVKQESELCNVYQYGIVDTVQRGRDGKFRKAIVRYRNHNEEVDRTTFRATRSLVVIHRVDEISVMQELGEIACQVDAERRNTPLKAVI